MTLPGNWLTCDHRATLEGRTSTSPRAVRDHAPAGSHDCRKGALGLLDSGGRDRMVRVDRPDWVTPDCCAHYTVAPAFPSILAMPRPAPRVAPATTATRPLICFGIAAMGGA